MPVISMFYGILIRMYLLDTQNHNLPHLHARYAEFEALQDRTVVSIPSPQAGPVFAEKRCAERRFAMRKVLFLKR